jgi:ABC-type antimicrobial peptide transport system permease subunit
VNEAFVRKYLGGRDPIGARFGFGTPVKYDIEIVGVAADAVYGDLRADSRPLIYGPYLWGNTYVIRFAGAAEAMAAAIRREMSAIDPGLEPEIDLVSVALERAVHRERLLSSLSSFFGVVALTLASVGLYGVMAFTVVRRTREIGLRMALGAPRSAVLRGELRSALLLVSAGVALGVPASLAAGHAIRTELFGVSPFDPIALVVGTAVMGLVTAAAAYLPARRASHIDPNLALRCE